MTDDELAAIKARRADYSGLGWGQVFYTTKAKERVTADFDALLAEVERLRCTSTPEIDANISRLAFKLGVTLGHLHQTGGRELECVLQRLEKAEADAAALREALASVVSRHVHENNSHHPEWIAARAALARDGGGA